MKKRKYYAPSHIGKLAWRRNSRQPKFSPAKFLTRKRKTIIAVLTLVLVISYFALLRPVVVAYATASSFKKSAHKIAEEMREQDFEAILKELGKMEKKMVKLNDVVGQYQYLSFIPGTAVYFKDSEHLTTAGVHGLKALRIGFEALEPYKEILGFKDDVGSNKEQDVNKLVAAVNVLPKLEPRYDEIAVEVHAVRLALDQVKPADYPQQLKGIKVQEQLYFAQEMLHRFDDGAPTIKAFLSKLPSVMGDPAFGDKKYLILMQNDKELRASGGFLTSYAILTLREGSVADVVAADTYDLDQRIGLVTEPHPVLSKYLQLDHWFARDANFSPDYVESAKTFYEFWQMVPNENIDGIFAIDTEVPAGFLEVLGPVTIEGYEEKFDSGNIIELMSDQARELREHRDRKALIGLLLASLESKVFDAPQEQWAPLFKKVLELLYEKHLLLYAFDPEVQSFFEAFNFAGRVVEYPNDYLYVNDTNLAGGKANFYIEQTITKEVYPEGDSLVSRVAVKYHNQGEYEAEINPGYQSYVRVHVPLGSELLASSGSLEAVKTDTDLGKTVFIALNLTPPKEESELIFRYKLPSHLTLANYSLLLQKQPGKPNDPYRVVVGDFVEEFELRTDKEIKL